MLALIRGGADVDEQESRALCRSKLRYPSGVTDEEWELIVRLIPPGKSGGGKRTVIMRSPQFGSCFENFVIRPKVSGQTLKTSAATTVQVLPLAPTRSVRPVACSAHCHGTNPTVIGQIGRQKGASAGMRIFATTAESV